MAFEATVVVSLLLVSLYSCSGCEFLSSDMDVDTALVVSSRCRQSLANNTVTVGAKVYVSVDERRCGVMDATNATAANTSLLCYSKMGNTTQRVAVSFTHNLRFSALAYTLDYGRVYSAAFMKRAAAIESLWNSIYLNSSVMMANGFERVTVTQILSSPSPPTARTTTTTTTKSTTTTTTTSTSSAPPAGRRRRRKKRSVPPTTYGVQVVAIVQFGPEGSDLTPEEYSEMWIDANNDTNTEMGWFTLDPTGESVLAVGECPSVGSFSSLIPTSVLSYSLSAPDPMLRLNLTETPSLGQVVNLVCPDTLQLSFDDDGFDAFDRRYSILCNTAVRWQLPTTFPTCVNFCPIILLSPPAATNLTAVPLNMTVAAGQTASYVCDDETLGVAQGPSPYFTVTCGANGSYIMPATDDDWPKCAQKTTPIPSYLVTGVNIVADRHTQELEASYMVFPIQEGDAFYMPVVGNTYMSNVFVPALIGMAVLVLVVCACSFKTSCMCQICAESAPIRRFLKPHKDKKKKRRLIENEQPVDVQQQI